MDQAIEATLAALHQARAIAILRTDDRSRATAAMAAAIDGGFRAVEVTLGVPGALELVAELARQPELIVGVGTVMTVAEAEAAVAAGARFVVSPVTDPAVIQAAAEAGAVAIPGAATPTEMWLAHRAGAPLVKLFPAPAGGPPVIRALLGPMPFLRLVPTNGVDEGNAAAYLNAGCFAVGCVSSLFDPVEVREGRAAAIRARAVRLLAAVALAARP